MARERWTLALIIICLPILTTVITAFRVRDLPKTQDISKLDGKKCENCDLKGNKVLKFESDKKFDDLKKSRDKVKPVVESKFVHKYDSSEADSEENDLDFSKLKTGFIKEKDTKASIVTRKINHYDDEDDDDDDDDDLPILQKPKLVQKPKVVPVNKKQEDKKHNNNKEDDDDYDDDDDGKDKKFKKLPQKSKVVETKPSILIKSKQEDTKIKITTDKQKEIKEINSEDDDDDDYDGLDNVDELFKILDIKKKPKSNVKVETKKSDDKSIKEDKSKKDHSDVSTEESKKVATKQPVSKEHDKTKASKDDKLTKKSEPLDSSEEKSDEVSKDDKSKTTNKKIESKPIITDKKPEKIQKQDGEKPAPKPLKEKVPETSKKEEGKTTKTPEKPKPDTTKKQIDDHKINKTETKPIPKKPIEKEQIKPNEKKPDQSPKKVEKESTKKPEPPKEEKRRIRKSSEEEIEEIYKSFEQIKPEIEKSMLGERENKKQKKIEFDSPDKSDDKSDDYLKQVTDALHRRNLLKSEFEDFYSFFPTFAPNFSRIHNPECRRHGLIVLRQLRGSKIWALNMLDATAKIPSGVLQGNGIQLGDFDQCLGSRARVQLDTGSVVKVQGKYCLARIEVKAEHSELEGPVYLAQAKSLIRSKIDDPGHFVPRFSTLSWGVCVPAACSSDDVEVFLKDAIKHYQHTSGVVVRVKVDEEDCHTEEGDSWEEWLELPTILTLSFYGLIILLVLVATIHDFLARRPSDEGQSEVDEKAECDQKDKENKEDDSGKVTDNFLSSFSLYHTIDKLIAPGTTDDISCIHGIRGLATIALLVAHKFLPVAVMPYTNRIKITEMASSPLWSWCRAGWIYTDCFLLLSGTLTAHRIANEKDSGAVRRLFSRYLRLTPALLAVVLFYAYIWDRMSSGPMWGTFVTKNAEVCQERWWWNLLYVQNYFGFEDMCAPQTHQLALDMQLTIIGGLLVWAVQSGHGMTRLILPAIHLISAYLRYTTVRDHRLTLLAYHGVSVSQLYRTARLSYMSIIHRCSPYLIGISLGLALKKPAKHGKIIITLGWITSIGLWALVMWAGADAGSTSYRYSTIFAAQYAAIAPLASAMAIAWVIYAVHTGNSGFLWDFLCCRPLVLISRISYALYLCQFIIFITNIGTVKTSKEFTLISLIDVQEIISILLLSILLTVTFVIPMQSLHKVFTFSTKTQTENDEKEPQKPEKEIPKVIEEKNDIKTSMARPLLAHREVLEEIPEVEVEYEAQRDKLEDLDEVIEEEEDGIGEEDMRDHLDDLEIIEEEEADEEGDGERGYDGDDRELDEWEWTNGNGRRGAQYYRYTR